MNQTHVSKPPTSSSKWKSGLSTNSKVSVTTLSSQSTASHAVGGVKKASLLSMTSPATLVKPTTSSLSGKMNLASSVLSSSSQTKSALLIGNKESLISTSTSKPTGKPVVIVAHLEALPEYNFSLARPSSPQEAYFLPPELDASVQAPPTPLVDTVKLKTTMINAVASSLLCSPDYRSSKDPSRRHLVKLGEQVSSYDPEFVLKLALYTRCDLNIRTTANFLLALATKTDSCRPYLRKYYSGSIRLPSDWIEVAEIYQAFHDHSINFGSLPNCLRKVMIQKFPDFDAYQLAKYNKDISKKKKNKKGKGDKGKGKGEGKDASTAKADGQKAKDVKGNRRWESLSSKPPSGSKEEDKSKDDSSSSDSESETDSESTVVGEEESESEEELERLKFTLKQLIRKLHISNPVDHVMCLVGKKYPEDPESFRRSHLPGTWDQDKAGKRMKLPTPETWETQISLRGNKASVWEELIDHHKLPFMAMLRNLRNLILACVSQRHHQWVMNKLGDERAVVNSRQFPFRFFSAYEVLGELEKKAAEQEKPAKPAPSAPASTKGKKMKRPPKELPKIDTQIIKKYRNALDTALKIATAYNVKPIAGTTIILCNVGSSMKQPCTSARGLGKPRTVLEVGVLLGLMCKYSCESCTLEIYGNGKNTEISLLDGTILHNMEKVLEQVESMGLGADKGSLPPKLFHDLLINRVEVDNLVILTDTMNLTTEDGKGFLKFLSKYRHMVNPNLLFVSVDLSSRNVGVSSTITPCHENNIHLAGYSDQILRFIAERGDSGQITYVENIDKAYNLREVKTPALMATADKLTNLGGLAAQRALSYSGPQKRWKTVRVFISSTFRDMHAERDLLTRFVFPELRARCQSRNIQLYEVDLRWGITEKDARSHKALEICLTEISRCQYFIGLLGQRYGWAPESYQVSDIPEYDWVREYPTERSITELEIFHGALSDPDKVTGKAFFYFRDPAFMNFVPQNYLKEFKSDSLASEEKIEKLKSQIRMSGLEVYDNYQARWLGIVDDKPMVTGLEDYGQRVLHNLWNAIQRDYPEDELLEDPVQQANILHDAFLESRASCFVGRRALLMQAHKLISSGENGIVVASGKPGCGKSAFMAAIAQSQMEGEGGSTPGLTFSHFIGAAPRSSNIAHVLTRLCRFLKSKCGIKSDIPEDYPDLVKEWPEFVREAILNMAGSRLVILIDGIDLLEDKHNGRSMDWLPETMPTGSVLVMSAIEGGHCLALLRQRLPGPAQVSIGAMDIFDKAEMVRRNLAKHRKALDESPFNNQMKLLLSKREASNPLYLHLACEELRVFGVYEGVTNFLRKMPATIPNLLQEVLARLETEHGTDFLSTALAFLCLARNGLKEYELAAALSSYFSSSQLQAQLPPMSVAQLLRSLQTFLQPTGQDNIDMLALAHKDIEKAVKAKFMRGAQADKERKLSQLLGQYFLSLADPDGDRSFKGNDPRAFSELPYYLTLAGAWKELEELLCNLHFVVAKCQLGLANQLLEEYSPISIGLPPAKAREVARFTHLPRVQAFKSFLSRNMHVLSVTPSLALQQAVNEPEESLVAKCSAQLVEESPLPLLKWVNKPSAPNPCKMMMAGHGGPVTAVAVSHDGTLFAIGSKNCVIKLFEINTGKEIHTYIGHEAAITSLCFVGQTALCSTSHASNLCLWDIKEGHRLAVMKGHSRSVRACAANTTGKIIASASWDMSVRTWDGTNGSFIATLKSPAKNSAVNCLAFHPEGQLVAAGSWDASIKIWDTFNRKKIKVLKGHRTSVQTCAYAPSGRHIISASLDGEIKIWTTKMGIPVGTISGHFAPVNSVCFTPNGQYLITASSDKMVKVWSAGLGQPVNKLGVSGENGFAHCLTYDSGSQTVVVGYHNGFVCKFNIQTGVQLFSEKVHEAAVVAISCQGSVYMTASVDGFIKIWSFDSLPSYVELSGLKNQVTCASWTQHGLAAATADLAITTWPPDIGKYKASLKQLRQTTIAKVHHEAVPPITILQGHNAVVSSIAFSPNKVIMVTASHDKSLIIWNLLTHKPMKTIANAHKDWVTSCVFTGGSGEYLITGSNDFTLKVWDMKTHAEKSTLLGHTSAISSVDYSNGCIISGAVDGSVKVWSQKKGIEITTLYCHSQRVNACVIDFGMQGDNKRSSTDWADMMDEEEDGNVASQPQKIKLGEVSVISASDDGTVQVCKPFIPNQIASLSGHSDRVLSVSASLNNEIFSSSMDGSVRIWAPDLPAEPGKLVATSTMLAHTGPVTATAICKSQDSQVRFAATSGRDGTFVVWAIKWEARSSKEVEKTKLVLEKLYQVKASEGALSTVTITSKSGVIVAKDSGEIEMWKFSLSEFPVKSTTLSSSTTSLSAPVTRLLLTEDRKFLMAGSWNSRVVAISGSSQKMVASMDTHSDWVMDLCLGLQEPQSTVYSIGLDSCLCAWPVKSLKAPQKARTPVSTSVANKHSLPLQKDKDRESPWPLCICDLGNGHLAIGDSQGRIMLWRKNISQLILIKKIHQTAVTALVTLDDGILASGSDDCTVKLWRLTDKSQELKQVGHFFCQSCVKTMDGLGANKSDQALLMVGDSLGHVTLLEWAQ